MASLFSNETAQNPSDVHLPCQIIIPTPYMIFVFFFTDNIFGSIFLHTKCTFSPKYVQFFQKYSKHFCILYQISPHDIILLHHICLWRLRQISCSSYSQLNHYLEIEWDDRHQCNCDCLLWNCKVIIAIRMVTGLCFSHWNNDIIVPVVMMDIVFVEEIGYYYYIITCLTWKSASF